MLSSSFLPSINLSPNFVAAHRRSSSTITASYAATANRAMAATGPSLYDVLGLSVGANGGEIKAAYRKLARECHPDASKKSSSADEFMRVHAAYSTLSDPSKRADYDRGRLLIDGQRKWTAHRESSRPRTWETDQCW